MQTPSPKSAPVGRFEDSHVERFRVLRSMKDNIQRINGIDWSRSGDSFITSSVDDSVHHYFITKTAPKALSSRKYGVDMIRFVNGKDKRVIIATRPTPNTKPVIRLWDLQENRFLKTYTFSTASPLVPKTGLVAASARQYWMACQQDGHVTLGSTLLEGRPQVFKAYIPSPVACFDHVGLIFAITLTYDSIELFDISDYQQGEVAAVRLCAAIPDWQPKTRLTSLQFSNDSTYLYFSTDNGKIYMLNAEDGQLVFQADVPNAPGANVVCLPSLSADNQWMVCGSTKGTISVWSVSTGALLKELTGHRGWPEIVAFSPTRGLLASADVDVALWGVDQSDS